jgi:hypothetical protein
MKRAMVVVTLLGLTSQANADSRDTWQGVFAGSLTVAAGGLMIYVHGATKVSDAEDELCARGAYLDDPSCSRAVTITPSELDRLNAKGERGATLANIGAVTTGAGLALAGLAFYKGFIAKPKRESTVLVTPTVSKDGAGAALQLRW